MNTRNTPERRRQVRRGRDLTKLKRKLAIGLTFVAASSFALGYLSGSGKLDDLRTATVASSPANAEAAK